MLDIRRSIQPRYSAVVVGVLLGVFVTAGLAVSARERTPPSQAIVMTNDDLTDETAMRASRDQRADAEARPATVVDMAVTQRPSTYTLTGRVDDPAADRALWMVIRSDGRYLSAHRVGVDQAGMFMASIPRQGRPPAFEVILVRVPEWIKVSGYVEDHPDGSDSLPESMTVAATLRVLGRGDDGAET